MRIFATLCVLFLGASVVSAGPIASVANDTTGGGANRFTFSLDPDGETNYTAVEIAIDATTNTFNSPQPAASFNPAEEGSAVIGTGTVTGGFTIVGIVADETNLDFTFTSFGGPPTSSFNGALAQVTGAGDLAGTAQFRFADAAGAIIDDFTQTINFGEVVGGNEILAGNPPEGTISLQDIFNDGSGRRDGGIVLSNAGDGDFAALGQITASLSTNEGGIYDVELDGMNVNLLLDVDLAKSLPVGVRNATLDIVSENGGSLQYTLTANVPEPATFGLASLALVGLVGLRRRS